MSYFTLKDGQRLYYEDKGHGSDTLIMMHGWTSTHKGNIPETDRPDLRRVSERLLSAKTRAKLGRKGVIQGKG